MIQAVALIACLCVSDEGIGGHLDLVKKLGNEYNIFAIAKLEPEIDKALIDNKIKNKDILFYLESVKNDIGTFKSLDGKTLKRIEEVIKNLRKFDESKITKLVDENAINLAVKEIKEIISVFGEFSFIDLKFSQAIVYLNVENFKNKDLTHKIESELARFQNSKWKNSPLLDNFYLGLSEANFNIKNYPKAYEFSCKSYDMRKTLCENQKDTILLAPVVFKFEAMKELGEYQKIILEFKNLSPELLETLQITKQYHLSRIYSCLASGYFGINKLELSIAYQEVAVSKMYSWVVERQHPWVQKEAILLQTYLAKKGDWAAVRTLEERYELKPLPKDAKEK